MTEATYSDRDVELVTIKKVHPDGRTVTWSNGWSFGGIPVEHTSHLAPGATFLVETQRLTAVTGLATVFVTRDGSPVVDQWLWHKSDVELDAEHEAMVAGFRTRDESVLAEHRDDWSVREAALPSALRRRIERFRSNGGHQFDVQGWGYELVVSELAVLYVASGGEDSEAVKDFARDQGTSGNQHGCAKALSRLIDDELDQVAIEAAEAFPSALSPITGNPDYSEPEASHG